MVDGAAAEARRRVELGELGEQVAAVEAGAGRRATAYSRGVSALRRGQPLARQPVEGARVQALHGRALRRRRRARRRGRRRASARRAQAAAATAPTAARTSSHAGTGRARRAGRLGRVQAEASGDAAPELELAREIVADDPPRPLEVERVEELAEAARARRRRQRRRRVDAHPARAGHERLDPRVRAVVAHGDVVADVVPLAAEVAVDVARGHARRAQQQRRRRREVLAVALGRLEQEALDGIAPRRGARQAQRVAVRGAQPAHDRPPPSARRRAPPP